MHEFIQEINEKLLAYLILSSQFQFNKNKWYNCKSELSIIVYVVFILLKEYKNREYSDASHVTILIMSNQNGDELFLQEM